MPIRFEDELLGVLTIESRDEDAFDDDDVRLLSTLSAHVAVCLHQTLALAESERMAVTDGLTGLYNYRYFHERLRGEMARCTRYSRPLSLVMIDLDNFKAINDRFGHLQGDEVLREVARRIKMNIRGCEGTSATKRADVDIASRYGGEEFIVIMPEAPAAGAAIAAERLRAVFESGGGTDRRPDRRQRPGVEGHRQLRRDGLRSRASSPTILSGGRTRRSTRPSARARTGCWWRRGGPHVRAAADAKQESGFGNPESYFRNKYATFRKKPSLTRCRLARLSVRSVTNEAP